MHPIPHLGKGNLFSVTDKPHKMNTVGLGYGQGNDCSLQNKLRLFNDKLTNVCILCSNGFLIVVWTVAR